VELIVLNIGLQAGILDTRTFSMFVLHAIVLTFITTPLTLLWYPTKYHVHVGSNKATDAAHGEEGGKSRREGEDIKTKFAMILDKIDQLPAAMTLTQFLLPHRAASAASFNSNSLTKSEKAADPPRPQIRMDALRLIELTARTSAVLKSQEAESLLRNDPVISVFRTFGYLNRMLVSAALSVVNYDQFPTAVADHARESESDMVIIPWCRRPSRSNDQTPSSATQNPFDLIFGKSSGDDMNHSVVYSEFIRKVFMHSPTDVALFVDRGSSSLTPYVDGADHHLFLPFFGGPDDRLALSFVVQLCSNPAITATVVRITKTNDLSPSSTIEEQKSAPVSPHNVSFLFRKM
jgi:hypothetical protein